jgi:hypothetical protein
METNIFLKERKDMDVLKIKTKFMRNVLSKIIETLIQKKTGYKVKIQLNDIDVAITDDNAHISLNVEADMNVNELKKITKIIGTEDRDL